MFKHGVKTGSGKADGKILLAQGETRGKKIGSFLNLRELPCKGRAFFPAGLPGIPRKVSGNSSFNLKISGIGEKSLNFKEDGS